MAPEIFDSKPYSIKADVYSFGVTYTYILIKKKFFISFKFSKDLHFYIKNTKAE